METKLDYRIFLKIAVAVIAPLLVLGIPARFADKHFGTSLWILLGAMFVAMHLTLAVLLWKFKKLLHNF